MSQFLSERFRGGIRVVFIGGIMGEIREGARGGVGGGIWGGARGATWGLPQIRQYLRRVERVPILF